MQRGGGEGAGFRARERKGAQQRGMRGGGAGWAAHQNQMSPKVTSRRVLPPAAEAFAQPAQTAVTLKLPPAGAGFRNAFHRAYLPPATAAGVSSTDAATV